MKTMWIVGIAVCAMSAGAAAQNTTTPGSQSTPGSQTPGSTTPQSGSRISVIGCVQRADERNATATGTSGAAGSSSSTAGDRFVLVNAHMGSAVSTKSGSSTPLATADSGSSYLLSGNVSDLRNHVGQQVQVVGRLDPSPSGSATRTGTSTAATASGNATGTTPATEAQSNRSTTTSSAMSSQSLQVQFVTMISTTCSGA